MLVISIGLALLLRFGLLFYYGGNRRPYFEYTLQSAWTLGPLRITPATWRSWPWPRSRS
jgi:neutral amino acid transport system permease protein